MAFWKLHRRPKRAVTHLGKGNVRIDRVGDAVLASAALVSRERVRSVVGRRQDWQSDVWELYDAVSELRFGVSWVANACSRTRLYVGKIDPDGSSQPLPIKTSETEPDAKPRPEDAIVIPTPDDTGNPDDDGITRIHEDLTYDDEVHPQADVLLAPLNELGGGQLGQSEMLRRLAIQLNVPGEGYLVGYDDPRTQERRWIIASSDEVTMVGGLVKLHQPEFPNDTIDLDPGQATILRIWRPHPRFAHQADSPLIALRQPLRELIDLSAHITASAESRLAGAGLLFVPDELTTPAPEQSEGVNPLHADHFTSSLIEAMAAPLKNRDSASAIVPLVVRGPADKGKELKYLTFATPLDARAGEMREAAIRRIATGLDLPAEVLTGLGDSNHWSAWAVEEGAIKLHVEPLLGLICDSLTTHFYQPAIKALGIEDWADYCIWYDTSDLTLRPNRAPEAQVAYEKGLISASATRRELGFSDEDAPTDEERVRNLITQVILTNANLAPLLLPFLGIDPPGLENALPQGTPAPLGGVPNPSNVLPGQNSSAADQRNSIPANGNPEAAASMERLRAAIGRTEQSALTSAGNWRTTCLDMAVIRALERAGHFLLKVHGRPFRQGMKDVAAHEIHVHLPAAKDQLDTMLKGAYTQFHHVTPGEPCLHAAVDHYVRALVLAREPHHRDYLDRALAQFHCDESGNP